MSDPKKRNAPRESGLEHFDEGDKMPYRWPRGAVVGPRRALHAAQAIVVLLVGVLIVAIVVLATHRL